MKRSQVDEILAKMQNKTAAAQKVRSVMPKRVPDNILDDDDDDDEYIPIGIKGMLAASQKLLAVNRGLDKTDERDSLMFKRIFTTDKLLAERIKLDAGRIRGAIMPLIAKHKNLKAIGPFTFDNYTEKLLIGNPLSSPLEEINPLHLLEQSRRCTQMGPGGIGSDQAITSDMQSIRCDQFGFLDPLAGPESDRIGIDTRFAMGTKMGSNGRVYQKFLDRRSGKQKWMSAEDLDGLTVKLPD